MASGCTALAEVYDLCSRPINDGGGISDLCIQWRLKQLLPIPFAPSLRACRESTKSSWGSATEDVRVSGGKAIVIQPHRHAVPSTR